MLTLLLPSKDRPSFLMRTLRYYQDVCLPYRIIVADSSGPTEAAAISDAVSRAGFGPDVSWRHYPPEAYVSDKVCDALEAVQTPYVVMAADDDFFVPAGLECAARYLEGDHNCAAVHGHALFFNTEGNGPYGRITELMYYLQRQIEGASAIDRLRDHLSCYSSNWYSVRRTADLRRNFDATRRWELKVHFLEQMGASLTVTRGTTKKLDVLYMVRQHANVKHHDRLSWTDRMKLDSWREESGRFQESLAGALAAADGLSMESARPLVTEACGGILSGVPAAPKAGPPSAVRALMAVWRERLRRVPGLVSAWRRVRYGRHGGAAHPEWEMSLARLLSPESRFHTEFLPIYRCLTSGCHERVPGVVPEE